MPLLDFTGLPALLAAQNIDPSDALALTISAHLPTFNSPQECWHHFGLPLSAGNRPAPNVDNLDRILKGIEEFLDLFWYDEFRDLTMIGKREINDNDVLKLLIVFQSLFHLSNTTKEVVRDAMQLACGRRTVHPVKIWLESLPKWDGKERLERLLILGLGAADTLYVRAVSKNFMVGMIARVYQPGCQLETMPVLESREQGIGKTTLLRILGADWYSNNTASMGEKDFLQALRGAWLVEIAELDNIRRTTLERVKATIARPIDEYFARYGRTLLRIPRQSVFCGTTNSNTWNNDDTGARRFWPIACDASKDTRAARMKAIAKNREQLFAEALHTYKMGASWYQVPEEQAIEEQEARHVEDPWTNDVTAFLHNLTRSVTLREVMQSLGLKTENMRSNDAYRVAHILGCLGWVKKRIRVHGELTWQYVKKSNTFNDVG